MCTLHRHTHLRVLHYVLNAADSFFLSFYFGNSYVVRVSFSRQYALNDGYQQHHRRYCAADQFHRWSEVPCKETRYYFGELRRNRKIKKKLKFFYFVVRVETFFKMFAFAAKTFDFLIILTIILKQKRGIALSNISMGCQVCCLLLLVDSRAKLFISLLAVSRNEIIWYSLRIAM